MQTQVGRYSHQVRSIQWALQVAFSLAITILIARPSVAQTFSASIAGTVTDPSGAMVAGATLQLENANTKDIRVQTSSKDGSYSFTNLLPGTYKLSVSAAGFKD